MKKLENLGKHQKKITDPAPSAPNLDPTTDDNSEHRQESRTCSSGQWRELGRSGGIGRIMVDALNERIETATAFAQQGHFMH